MGTTKGTTWGTAHEQQSTAIRTFTKIRAHRGDYHYFNSSLTVDDIASSVGISRSHLYRLFIQHIDMSPNEYLLHYRLSKASELLKGSVSLTIGEVAYSTGFADQLYFSRAFKKQKGISPKYYAANHAKTSKTSLE